MHTKLTLPSLSVKKNIKSMLYETWEEIRFSHFHPCLADVFLQERVERCRPGHFIITARKDSMILSQGSKEGCLYNIPLPLVKKCSILHSAAEETLFSLMFLPLSFCFCRIRMLSCLDFFVLSAHTYCIIPDSWAYCI